MWPIVLFIVAFLLASAETIAAAADLRGSVKDGNGSALVGARLTVLSPQRAVVATATTDQSGAFTLTGLVEGEYVLSVEHPSFAAKHISVDLAGSEVTSVDVVLELVAFAEDVTVTAAPGLIEDATRLTQPVNLISEDEVLVRAKTVVAQVVEGETGLFLQRTSPGMAGIFVRGLTGNKVNIFVDGVRYSNGAQRGGVNTFLDLIDPMTLDSVEVLRGTSSAQHGSDALGGSIQFLTHVPTMGNVGSTRVGGAVTVGGETAHPGGVGNLALGYSAPTFGVFGSIAGRKTGDYRPGGGNDSHAATLRFLGLETEQFIDEDMPGTGFRQFGSHLRANWAPTSNTLFVANYLSSRQDGANRWDQILGGDGNLIAELNDLQLDLFYARLESLSAGWFDRASATYSFNTQREERVNQGGNGNPAAAIVHQPERTSVNGLQFNASKDFSTRYALLVGGDVYFESSTSDSFDVNPATGASTVSRPRVPSGATYRQGGVFGQTTVTVVPDRFTLTGAARFGFNAYRASQADAPIVGGRPLWSDDSLDTTNVTFRLGAAFTPVEMVTFSAAVSTGYRAPHMTDLGTLGLTGSGFEVSAPDVAGMNASVGSTADATAVSTGNPVVQVVAEENLNFDVGVNYRTSRVRAQFGAFVNDIEGSLEKFSLILPQGAVGQMLGTERITAQGPTGVVFVAPSTAPVLARVNRGDARVWGVEWTGEFAARSDVTMGSTYTYLHAASKETGLPPNIEGGTPAPGGTVWVRYMRRGGPWWVEPYLNFAGGQSRLSTLDLGDRRTGAVRTRASIQNFFRRGATVRGWVMAGPDGIFGNADDLLTVTNETLGQVQDRVLGPGVNSSQLVSAIPGYAVFGIRFGVRLGAHSVLVDAENLGDENYRGISWGMDAPGRGISVRYRVQF
jgi:outer membrane receptor protein involved in Fe transport